MDQSEAAKVAREMTRTIASAFQAERTRVSSARMQHFQGAAFGHASDFIPEGADWVVTENPGSKPEGLPLLLALDGSTLFRLYFSESVSADDPELPRVTCSATTIDPLRSSATVDSLHRLTRIGDPIRESKWHFNINGEVPVVLETRHEGGEEPEQLESFTQVLSRLLGFPDP